MGKIQRAVIIIVALFCGYLSAGLIVNRFVKPDNTIDAFALEREMSDIRGKLEYLTPIVDNSSTTITSHYNTFVGSMTAIEAQFARINKGSPLPVTGYSTLNLYLDTSTLKLYVATETVKAATSWIALN